MKIAVVGAGISGLTTAFVLSRQHDVTLFEAANRAGGHAHTVDVLSAGHRVPVDTGFIVFNQPNYPKLCQLFDCLRVESIDSDMSFSVSCERTGLEYNGTSLNKLFSQRRNIVRPSFLRMLSDIVKFNRRASKDLEAGMRDTLTIEEYAGSLNVSRQFVEHYLLPLGASLWSCDTRTFGRFPARFVVEFLKNHYMLQVEGRPTWKTVRGGSRVYVRRLLDQFRGTVRLGTAVEWVARHGSKVQLKVSGGDVAQFDEVVLAIHADQSGSLVQDADSRETEVLDMFPYQRNQVTLHTDAGLMPKQQNAWASWNYKVPSAGNGSSTVTYHMNALQRLQSRENFMVSLNQDQLVDETKVLRRLVYHHPLFKPGRDAAQKEHGNLIRRRGISYCGAYWGHGFHEDGVASGLRVCQAFDMDLTL